MIDFTCPTMGTIGLTVVNANKACTPTSTAGAMVAMIARFPNRSANPPKKGDNVAEIIYGIDMTVDACKIADDCLAQKSYKQAPFPEKPEFVQSMSPNSSGLKTFPGMVALRGIGGWYEGDTGQAAIGGLKSLFSHSQG